MIIRAKSNGLDLFSHSEAVKDTAYIFNAKGGFNLDRKIIRWMCILHDLGKANPLFQSNMDNQDFTNVCRHEISSILFIDCVPNNIKDEVALSILSHHKSINNDDRSLFQLLEQQEDVLFNNHINNIEEWGKMVKKYLFYHYDIEIEIPSYKRCVEIFEYYFDLIEKIDANATIKKMNESLMHVNKQLEETVVKDSLTGIYNREGYATKMREIEKKENIIDCVVLYFDLDNFKYYNDTFGHDVGDVVLVQLAKILQFLAEENGIPIRYGGDEFLLIIPEITIEQAEGIAKEFYNILKQREYFIPKIEQILKKKVDIPETKRISKLFFPEACGRYFQLKISRFSPAYATLSSSRELSPQDL